MLSTENSRAGRRWQGDGLLFVGGRVGFRDLKAYLQTQFTPATGRMDKWPNAMPPGTPVVTADKVVFGNEKELRVVARADGRGLWRGASGARGTILPDGLAVAAGGLYAATAAGEVVCLAAR